MIRLIPLLKRLEENKFDEDLLKELTEFYKELCAVKIKQNKYVNLSYELAQDLGIYSTNARLNYGIKKRREALKILKSFFIIKIEEAQKFKETL